jgi:hypothetical protein
MDLPRIKSHRFPGNINKHLSRSSSNALELFPNCDIEDTMVIVVRTKIPVGLKSPMDSMISFLDINYQHSYPFDVIYLIL